MLYLVHRFVRGSLYRYILKFDCSEMIVFEVKEFLTKVLPGTKPLDFCFGEIFVPCSYNHCFGPFGLEWKIYQSVMSVNERVKQRLQAALKQQSGGLLGLSNLFKEYDTDGSGSLNWEEFCTALSKCGLTPSPQDIRALFLELDKDGNNEISYNEFIHRYTIKILSNGFGLPALINCCKPISTTSHPR